MPLLRDLLERAQDLDLPQMAEAVIESLEAVKIQHQQREAGTRASMTRDLVLDPREQRSAVGDARQRIAEREPTKRIPFPLQTLAHSHEHGDARRRDR